MDDIAAEGQGESCFLLAPPGPQVDAAREPFFPIGQLALVDDQAKVCLVLPYHLEDLIERHNHVIDFRGSPTQPKLKREKCACHPTRHGDALPDNLPATELSLPHQHGTIPVSHAGSAWEESVLIADVGVCV